jgi:hypothetical protein
MRDKLAMADNDRKLPWSIQGLSHRPDSLQEEHKSEEGFRFGCMHLSILSYNTSE